MSQNRKWISLFDFYEGIKLFRRCCRSKNSILILNPQVVKEIVTDIMIIISPYFFLDNILRNILVSRKVLLEEELTHATYVASRGLLGLLAANLFSSIALRISKSPRYFIQQFVEKRGFLFERKLNSV